MPEKVAGVSQAEAIAAQYAKRKWGREPEEILAVELDADKKGRDIYVVRMSVASSVVKCEIDPSRKIKEGTVCYVQPSVTMFQIIISVDTAEVTSYKRIEEEPCEHEVHVDVVDVDSVEPLSSPMDEETERLAWKYGIHPDRFKL